MVSLSRHKSVSPMIQIPPSEARKQKLKLESARKEVPVLFFSSFYSLSLGNSNNALTNITILGRLGYNINVHFVYFMCSLYSSSNSFSHISESASDGILQSERGERVIVPILGPSGRQERLNCWEKNLLIKVLNHL